MVLTQIKRPDLLLLNVAAATQEQSTGAIDTSTALPHSQRRFQKDRSPDSCAHFRQLQVWYRLRYKSWFVHKRRISRRDELL